MYQPFELFQIHFKFFEALFLIFVSRRSIQKIIKGSCAPYVVVGQQTLGDIFTQFESEKLDNGETIDEKFHTAQVNV